MASLSLVGVAEIDYSLVDGRVRSFELNGQMLFNEQGTETPGWQDQLYQVVLDYSLDIDKGRGLHAFVPALIEEYHRREVGRQQ